MKKALFLSAVISLLAGCQHETVDDRAAREASDYTKQMCPTPIENFTRTDSLVFNRATRTLIYYCAFSDKMDDEKMVAINRNKLVEGLKAGIKNDIGLKTYLEAGIHVMYVVHSTKEPQKVLFKEQIY